MTGLTEAIGRFVSNPGFSDIPDAALQMIKSGFIDAAGSLICGRSEAAVGVVQRYVEQSGQASIPEASVLFGSGRVSAEAAAMINAIACHVLDYDDVGLRGHPSTVLVPPILAEAERRGLSGADTIRAYLVGYEVWAELDLREPGVLHVKGWHPTSAVGVVAAAAAIASLVGLDAERARNAIALSASLAGGIVANFGSMAKPFQVAHAASSAILVVRLAEAGMDGSTDALEHHAGLLSAMSPKGEADRLSAADGLGQDLRILERGLSFKKYPMCYCTHRVIDAVIDLAREHDLQPADVRSVTTRIGETQLSMLRNHRPTSGLEAKFSIEFAVASALVSRAIGMRQIQDGYVNRGDIQALIGKVVIESDRTVCPVEPAFAVNDRVLIETTDGRMLDSGDVRFARGHARHPLSPDELKLKFVDCCSEAADIDSARLYQMLASLEAVGNVRELALH